MFKLTFVSQVIACLNWHLSRKSMSTSSSGWEPEAWWRSHQAAPKRQSSLCHNIPQASLKDTSSVVKSIWSTSLRTTQQKWRQSQATKCWKKRPFRHAMQTQRHRYIDKTHDQHLEACCRGISSCSEEMPPKLPSSHRHCYQCLNCLNGVKLRLVTYIIMTADVGHSPSSAVIIV